MTRWALAGLVGLLVALAACVTAKNGSGGTTNASMWVATQGDQMVRSYSVALSTGAVSQVGNAVATGVQPEAMALSPDGKTLFIANKGDNTVTAYTVASDGSLSSQGSPIATGEFPVALATEASGKFLFVANQGTFSDNTSGSISVVSLQGNATQVFLTETLGDNTDTGPTGIAVSPSGNFLYVANQFTNTVQSYSFDATSGALALINTYPAGTNPSAVAFSRCAGGSTVNSSCAAADAASLFVANAGSNNISIFAACIQPSSTCPINGNAPDGTLTPLSSGSPVAAGIGPAAFMVDLADDFVYVLDRGSSQVSGYKYSPVTGALTSVNPAAISTGASPFSGGITANNTNTTSTKNWIYVTNNGASSVSAFSVNTGSAGRLNALSTGPISVPGQPSAILVK